MIHEKQHSFLSSNHSTPHKIYINKEIQKKEYVVLNKKNTVTILGFGIPKIW